jgi:hypothetical protein
MKKFNFHNTYEERAEALKTFKAEDIKPKSHEQQQDDFQWIWYFAFDLELIDIDEMVEDLLPRLFKSRVFPDYSTKETVWALIFDVPSKKLRAYIKDLTEESVEEMFMEEHGTPFDWDNVVSSQERTPAPTPSVTDKAQDGERPEKKIIEITAADEDRWEEVVKAFDAFKNKLDAQVREFLTDRDKQPEGALTLEDAEKAIYGYTVLAGKHAFDIEQTLFDEEDPSEEMELEEVEVEEPEVEAIEEEIPADEEEDELEKLLAEEK